MAELIDKKSALNALDNASYGNFNYVTARNAIDCVPTTTESKIRTKAIDEFAEKMKKRFALHTLYNHYDVMDGINIVAELIKKGGGVRNEFTRLH